MACNNRKIIYGLALMNAVSVTGAADTAKMTRAASHSEVSQKTPTFKEKECVSVYAFDKNRKCFWVQKCKPELSSIGAKAHNLAFLNSLEYVPVPQWMSISTSVFREVVRQSPSLQNSLLALYETMEEYPNAVDKDRHEAKVFAMAAAIREKITQLDLPSGIVSTISEVFDTVSEGGEHPVAVRSSAIAEDLPGASFAGLYDSFLNIRDYPAFLEALKMCWASTFNDRAVQYYMQKGLSLRDIYMSVVVMQLVNAKVSGTVFTIDVTTGYKGVHIMASNGLEAVVGGDISADSFLLNPETGMILKTVKGSKAYSYVPKANGSGLDKIALIGENNYCLTSAKVKELGALVKKIEADYQSISQGPIDTEFVLKENGDIFLVQVRPVVMSGASEVDDIDFDALKGKKIKSIAYGKHAVFGVKHGRVKIIEDFHDLESNKIQILPDDIVVTVRTENQWTQYLSKFSGIITTEGNPTSHPVLISREKGVPCLVGVADAVEKFRDLNGQWVTLDGFRKTVYAGKQPLKRVSLDKITEAFKVVEEEKLQDEGVMVRDLFSKNFMIEAEGKYWITGVNSNFSGALLDMMENAYGLREYVINKSGVKPPVSFQTEQRRVMSSPTEGKIYDHWWKTHVEQLELCKDMELVNYQKFYADKGEKMRELVEVCRDFDLSLDSWKRVRSVYEEVTAFQLLGFLERYPLIHHTYQLAQSLGVPRLFFEEFAGTVQEYEFEEDVEFLNATKILAKELCDLCREQGIDISLLQLENVKAQFPDFYASLVSFSRNYKFVKVENWIESPPLDKAFAKVMEQIKSQDFELVRKKSYEDAEESFFVEHPELREWIRLSIVKKLQQNDIHHVRPRAQWQLRDKILILGNYLYRKHLLAKPEDILLVSLAELEQFIEKHGEKAYLEAQK